MKVAHFSKCVPQVTVPRKNTLRCIFLTVLMPKPWRQWRKQSGIPKRRRSVIEIRIPRKELNRNFVYKLDNLCKEFDVQARVIIIDVIPVPLEQITVKGEVVVREENNEQKSL
jgi:hypothetical protein